MNILKELSNIRAVSGNEMYLIMQLFPELVKKYRPKGMPLIDAMGNVTLFRRGKSHSKTVAVITHTDEAGFIIKDVTDKGFLKFEEVGTIDPRVIISKKVKIGENAVKGIIGMKAIHLQKKEEREAVAKIKDLFIDIGAKDKSEALKQINIGDYVSFDTDFAMLNAGVIKGKALDRLGIACVKEAISVEPQFDTYYIFAAQRHIGARGALVSLERISPDYAFIIDAAQTADTFGAKPHYMSAALRGGAVICAIDDKGISDRTLYNKAQMLAKAAQIKAQSAKAIPAAGELGAVRGSYGGTKALFIGIPCRYINSPVQLMAKDDISAVTVLLKMILTRID